MSQINAYLYPNREELEEQIRQRDADKATRAAQARYGNPDMNQIVSDALWPCAKFTWFTHKGDALKLKDMATPHLFYSLRMLFNNTVPPVFRVGEFKRYRDIPFWSDDYKQQAFFELTRALSRRDDLDQELRDQFSDILGNAHALVALGVNNFEVPTPVPAEVKAKRKAPKVKAKGTKVRGYTRNGYKVRGYTR